MLTSLCRFIGLLERAGNDCSPLLQTHPYTPVYHLGRLSRCQSRLGLTHSFSLITFVYHKNCFFVEHFVNGPVCCCTLLKLKLKLPSKTMSKPAIRSLCNIASVARVTSESMQHVTCRHYVTWRSCRRSCECSFFIQHHQTHPPLHLWPSESACFAHAVHVLFAHA